MKTREELENKLISMYRRLECGKCYSQMCKYEDAYPVTTKEEDIGIMNGIKSLWKTLETEDKTIKTFCTTWKF